MTSSEKTYLKEGFASAKQRLEELLGRPVKIVHGWHLISAQILHTHSLFSSVVKAYAKQCDHFLGEIGTSKRPYEVFRGYMHHLFRVIDLLRGWYLAFFQSSFTSKIYNYLFILELLKTFQEPSVTFSRERFIVIPRGKVQRWPVTELLVGQSFAWLEDSVKEELKEVRAQDVSGFNCHPDEPLARQTVLSHELFHILLKRVGRARDTLKALAEKKVTPEELHVESEDQVLYHLTELFCDFASCWHFGPAYAGAFLDEIVLADDWATHTHPPRITRAVILTRVSKGFSAHPDMKKLKRFIDAHKDDKGKLKPASITKIVGAFRLMLEEDFNLPLYKWNDVRGDVVRSFDNRLTYLYGDIRTFINNLPDRSQLSQSEADRFDGFVTESVRKNVLFFEFSASVRPKAKLFPSKPLDGESK